MLVYLFFDYPCPPYWETKDELAKAIGRAFLDNSFLCTGIYGNKPIVYGTCGSLGIRQCYYLPCPYCRQKQTGWQVREDCRESGRISIARTLLAHIESAHPDHPLTEPR